MGLVLYKLAKHNERVMGSKSQRESFDNDLEMREMESDSDEEEHLADYDMENFSTNFLQFESKTFKRAICMTS